MSKSIKRFFPKSTISTVHQSGQVLTEPHQGVTVEIHWRDGEETPCSAEVSGGDEYAECGLEFNGKTLVGYDGVFDLPQEVIETLKDQGFSIDL